MKKGLGEEKYESDCAETAADADHTAYILHVARTRYYIIIIKVYYIYNILRVVEK